MANSLSSAQIIYLKRQAKIFARKNSLTQAEALDLAATQHGFANWSLLSKANAVSSGPAKMAAKAPAGPATIRYYLHGDQYEIDPTVYSCARCDSFSSPDHFEDSALHPGQYNEERYLESIKRWNEQRDVWQGRYRRPEDATRDSGHCAQVGEPGERLTGPVIAGYW